MEASTSPSSSFGTSFEPATPGMAPAVVRTIPADDVARCQITSLRIHRTECSGKSRRYWVSAILDARYRLAGVRVLACQDSVRVHLPGEESGGSFFQPVGAAACRALRRSLAQAFAERLALDAPAFQPGSRPALGRELHASHPRHPRGERPRTSTTHRKETR